jgi:hypothetical protein
MVIIYTVTFNYNHEAEDEMIYSGIIIVAL